jgi:hypothetical protein
LWSWTNFLVLHMHESLLLLSLTWWSYRFTRHCKWWSLCRAQAIFFLICKLNYLCSIFNWLWKIIIIYIWNAIIWRFIFILMSKRKFLIKSLINSVR